MYTRNMMTGICIGLMFGTACGPEGFVPPPQREATITPEVLGSRCIMEEDTDGEATELTAAVLSTAGRELEMTTRIVTGAEGQFRKEREITVDGELLMITRIAGDETFVSVQTDYGDLITGIESASALVENDTVTGEVDGHRLEPMRLADADAASAKFADGTAAPTVAMPADIEAALNDLLDAAAAQSRNCGDLSPPVTQGRRLISGGSNDHGHDSDPEVSIPCALCWVGCSTAFVGCAIGVSAACAAAGPFYVVCEVIALASCGVAYGLCQYGCYNGGPCCPVSCGEVACCESDETCLNAQTGLCCSPGKTACVGESCCSSTEVCIGQGAHAGTCCEAESVCGDNCCGALDSCVPHLSLCCPFNQPACGNGCCDSGEQCMGNNLCCPADRVCGAQCCPAGSGCNMQTMTCTSCQPGYKFCSESGSCCPDDKVCSPVAGECCEPGEYYCGGGCRPFSECLY